MQAGAGIHRPAVAAEDRHAVPGDRPGWRRRKNLHVEVTHVGEDAIEGGVVGHGAKEKRFARRQILHMQPAEPPAHRSERCCLTRIRQFRPWLMTHLKKMGQDPALVWAVALSHWLADWRLIEAAALSARYAGSAAACNPAHLASAARTTHSFQSPELVVCRLAAARRVLDTHVVGAALQEAAAPRVVALQVLIFTATADAGALDRPRQDVLALGDELYPPLPASNIGESGIVHRLVDVQQISSSADPVVVLRAGIGNEVEL